MRKFKQFDCPVTFMIEKLIIILNIMEPITHSFAGYFIGKVITGYCQLESIRTPLLACSIIASNIPDFDSFLIFNKWTYIKYHRGPSHSILFILPFALIIAFFFSVFLNKGNFYIFFFVSVVALLFHLFFDYINSYGTQLLYPLKEKRYALDLNVIVDLYMLGILFTGYIAGHIYAGKMSPIALNTLVAVLFWILTLKLIRINALKKAKVLFKNSKNTLHILPATGSLIKPWFVNIVTENKSNISLYSINTLKRTAEPFHIKTFTKKENERIILSKKLPEIKVFLSFSRFPVVEEIKNKIIWRDLRFYQNNKSLGIAVEFDKGGKVTGNPEFKF
ncbi:MAG: metal-dependent hydrolase [Thermodesulfobacteriota bacterium]|nr:metal-dependent hydrolase [Thermodesulfobacteriota bacterium]